MNVDIIDLSQWMWKDLIVFSLAINICFSKCSCIVYAARKYRGQTKDFLIGSNYSLCIGCMALFSTEIVFFILICWRQYFNMIAVGCSKGLLNFTIDLFFKVPDCTASFSSWFWKTYKSSRNSRKFFIKIMCNRNGCWFSNVERFPYSSVIFTRGQLPNSYRNSFFRFEWHFWIEYFLSRALVVQFQLYFQRSFLKSEDHLFIDVAMRCILCLSSSPTDLKTKTLFVPKPKADKSLFDEK